MTSLVQLHELIGIAGRPAYVKAASEQVREVAPVVIPQQCADGYHGEYRCGTKEETWLSAVKLASAEIDPEEKETIQIGIAKFAKFWGIEADVRDAQAKIAAASAQVSLEDYDFALVQEHRGEKIRKFAAFDDVSTQMAAAAFYENRHRYPMAWRKQASLELIKRSEEHLAVLPDPINDYLHKAAGFGYPSAEALEDAILERTAHLGTNQKVASVKLAEALGAIADHPALRYNNDLVRDTLEVLDRFDHSTKLAQHYGGDIRLPEEILDLSQPRLQKAAAYVAGGCRLQNGAHVNVHDLTKEALAAVSGELAAMSLSKLAAVLPTLPAPDANVLCRAQGIETKVAAVNAGRFPKRADAMPAPAAGPMPAPPGQPQMPAPAGAGAPPAAPGQPPAGPMDPAMDPAAAGAPQSGAGAVPGPDTPAPAPGAPGAAQAPAPLEKQVGQAAGPRDTAPADPGTGSSLTAGGAVSGPDSTVGTAPTAQGGNAPAPDSLATSPEGGALFDPADALSLDPTKDPAMQGAAPSHGGQSLLEAGGGGDNAGVATNSVSQEQPVRSGVVPDAGNGLPAQG